MLKAVTFGHEQSQAVINMIIELAEACAKEPWDLPGQPEQYDGVAARVKELATEPLTAAYKLTVKQERVEALGAARDTVMTVLEEEELDTEIGAAVFKKVEKDIVRGGILKTGQRIDGRDTKTVRDITAEVGILPRAHGSALFTRGETQALVVTTLGTGQDEQIIDALEGEYRESFLLHYNFPPYSVGEASFLRSPGRREIGHGKLAWRAVRPLLPARMIFHTRSGLSRKLLSLTVRRRWRRCARSSMSLMDAGVPLVNPVAGIAMGLIKEGEDFAVLSDILGDEDHLGDMDFKVAGTSKGVTSLQMDIKITSITEEIMRIALDQARDGRIHILAKWTGRLRRRRNRFPTTHRGSRPCRFRVTRSVK